MSLLTPHITFEPNHKRNTTQTINTMSILCTLHLLHNFWITEIDNATNESLYY